MGAGETAALELLNELNAEQEGFSLSEPSAGPTTPGVPVQPPVSPPLLAASSILAATSTREVAPEATALATDPPTGFAAAVDTYLRPAVTALEPYTGTAVATTVVAGAVVVGWLAWRAATSCGGPCAFRPSVF